MLQSTRAASSGASRRRGCERQGDSPQAVFPRQMGRRDTKNELSAIVQVVLDPEALSYSPCSRRTAYLSGPQFPYP